MGWKFNQGPETNLLNPSNSELLGQLVTATQTPKAATVK